MNNKLALMKSTSLLAIRLLCLLGAALLLPIQWCAGAAFGFEETGSMITARDWHTATLLPNKQVLAAGGVTGEEGTYLDSAELYDPATSTWTATGSLAIPRAAHTATLLPDGRVLIAGG
jgi:hypothetical protein